MNGMICYIDNDPKTPISAISSNFGAITGPEFG